jgi:hypothetical protein
MKWSTFWAAVAAIGAVGTVWVGIKALQHEPKPIATVTYGTIPTVPEITRQFRSCAQYSHDIHDFLMGMDKRMRTTMADLPLVCRAPAQDVDDRIVAEAADSAPHPFFQELYASHSYIDIHVVNKGDAAAIEMKLQIPAANVNLVTKGGDPDSPLVVRDGVAELPKLGPTEELELRAFLQMDDPRSTAHKIRLWHSTGTGEVTIRGLDEPRDPFWIYGGVGVVIVLWVIVMMWRESSVRRAVKGVTDAIANGIPDRKEDVQRLTAEWYKKEKQVYG